MPHAAFPAVAVLRNALGQAILVRESTRPFPEGPLFGTLTPGDDVGLLLRDGMDAPWGEADKGAASALMGADRIFHGTVREGRLVTLGEVEILWSESR